MPPDLHSNVVGGSTAKRALNCLGSRRLIAKAPPGKSSPFARRGTMLHNAMEVILLNPAAKVIGTTYEDQVLTRDLYDEKIVPALEAFDLLVTEYGGEDFEFAIEPRCDLASIPGAFGFTDLIGRNAVRTLVLDWKFGDGVSVSAEESDQGMFYAGAAMETPELRDLFEERDDWPVEIVIIQPTSRSSDPIDRWMTTVGRIKRFVRDLAAAVEAGKAPDAPLSAGDWCKFCPARASCPEHTGMATKALAKNLSKIGDDLPKWLDVAEQLEGWIKAVKEEGHRREEAGQDVPGWKLVAKRSTRKWVDIGGDIGVARDRLVGLVSDASDVVTTGVVSPAQAEKVLKKEKIDYDTISDLVVSLSTGTTLVRESDKRSALKAIGKVKLL